MLEPKRHTTELVVLLLFIHHTHLVQCYRSLQEFQGHNSIHYSTQHFDQFSTLLRNEEWFPPLMPVIVAAALPHDALVRSLWHSDLELLHSIAPDTTVVFLACPDTLSQPGQGVSTSWTRIDDQQHNASTSIRYKCADGQMSTFINDLEKLLEQQSASMGAVNLLLYGATHHPVMMVSTILFTVHQHSQIQRAVVALESDGAVQHVSVFDIATRQRRHYKQSSLSSVFQGIYDRLDWSSEGHGSGLGSSLEYTQPLRQQLVPLLVELGVKTMVDAPCGAMLWMPLVLEEMEERTPGFRYCGLDVTPSVIKDAIERFKHKSNWSFACMDVSEARFPVDAPDLVFSRDAMQHLPYSTIHSFLSNVKRQNAKYLLIGSYLNSTGNANINAGLEFDINLLLPPFNMRPPPLRILTEHAVMASQPAEEQKYMLLFDVARMEWDEPTA